LAFANCLYIVSTFGKYWSFSYVIRQQSCKRMSIANNMLGKTVECFDTDDEMNERFVSFYIVFCSCDMLNTLRRFKILLYYSLDFQNFCF